MKLEMLLPIQAARERHAQRIYHEKKNAFELAESAKKECEEKIQILNQKHASLLTRVLHDNDKMSVDNAQNLLSNAALHKYNINDAEVELEHLKVLLNEASENMNSARLLYLQKVQTHHKMKKLCKMEMLRKLKTSEMLAEMNVEDEFNTAVVNLFNQGSLS